MQERLLDILWVSLAAFGGFELALGANYLLLKVVLRAMNAGLGRREPPAWQKFKVRKFKKFKVGAADIRRNPPQMNRG